MAGKLIVCPTPIGNMGDITMRALAALQTADWIAAEDTRHTLGLLNHFNVKKPLISCHQHNEEERSDEILEKLLAGQTVVLVSDAGTPAISDPGQVLVRRCVENGIEVTALPGACAFVTALSASGMPSRRFVFEGFLPQNHRERREALERLKTEVRTILFYEAPHHLKETLEDLLRVFGDRTLVLARELTKVHEEYIHTRLTQAIAQYAETEPRGEYVLIVEGAPEGELRETRQKEYSRMSIAEHMAMYADLPEKEAMKRVAADRGLRKRDIYAALVEKKNTEE